MEIYLDEVKNSPDRNYFDKNYKILEVLGSGSYGKVLKCIELQTEEVVAIKIIDTINYTNKYLNKIRIEYKILQTLSHPNIIQFRKFFECNDKFHFVMDFVKGGSLNKLIQKKQKNSKIIIIFYQLI